MGKTILIVDDEKAIVDILRFNLMREGYDTVEAYDGEEALALAESRNPDLVLLDVMLPKLDGFEVCRRIRTKDLATPIIMLTAREDETSKIFGLENGADDYITKPFSIRELSARVKANIRRTGTIVPSEKDGVSVGIVIDPVRYTVTKDGVPLDLTSREFDILNYMAAAPGKVFSREELLRDVWQYDYYGDLRTVDVAMRRLREKIEDDSANPVHIITKRGIGYYYEK